MRVGKRNQARRLRCRRRKKCCRRRRRSGNGWMGSSTMLTGPPCTRKLEGKVDEAEDKTVIWARVEEAREQSAIINIQAIEQDQTRMRITLSVIHIFLWIIKCILVPLKTKQILQLEVGDSRSRSWWNWSTAQGPQHSRRRIKVHQTRERILPRVVPMVEDKIQLDSTRCRYKLTKTSSSASTAWAI